jgi:DNA-binding response OmpR family regulator
MSAIQASDDSVKILVVDDEPSAVEELVFTLSAAGLPAVGATTALQGLETFLRDSQIGVIVSDIRMPSQDGISFLKKVRRCGARGADCEVILVTGFPEVASAIDAIDIRVGRYLLKPFEPDEILAAASAALSRFRDTRSFSAAQDLAMVGLKRLLGEPRPDAVARSLARPVESAVDADKREQKRISMLKSMLEFRDARSEILPQEVFGDPAWFMLLELALIDRSGKRTSVSGLCMSARVSQTTALRRLHDMVEAGLIERRNDPADRRRSYISLSSEAQEKLDILLDRIASGDSAGPDWTERDKK